MAKPKPSAERPEPTERVEFDDAGSPEPSLIDVQNMLDGVDGLAPTDEPVVPPMQAEARSPLAADAALEVVLVRTSQDHIDSAAAAGLPHALDLAPVNSKIVVTREGAVLATPAGPALLDAADVANRLPTGARIQKREDATGTIAFHADQLDPSITRPTLVTANAHDAIQGFLPHFHPTGLPR